MSDESPEANAISSAPQGEPRPAADRAPTQVTLRRAPRYRAFVLTGAVLGLAFAVFFAYVRPPASSLVVVNGASTIERYAQSQGSALLLLSLGFALIGGLLGALLAIGIERRRGY